LRCGRIVVHVDAKEEDVELRRGRGSGGANEEESNDEDPPIHETIIREPKNGGRNSSAVRRGVRLVLETGSRTDPE
jgi:hypothetical protein